MKKIQLPTSGATPCLLAVVLFPDDFMFELTKEECNSLIISLRSQFVTLNNGRGHNIKYAPLVFTEQGVAMLSSVLKSATAIQVNISIMRAFVMMCRRRWMTFTLRFPNWRCGRKIWKQ